MNIQFADQTIAVIPSNDSYRYRKIMGENALTLKVELLSHVEIPVGAYCEYQGEVYTLLAPENIIKHDSRKFEYTIILEAASSKLGLYKLKDYSKRLKFSLTGKPEAFLQLIVDNLNERDSGWSVGNYIEMTEKVLDFNHNYIDAALKMVADEFKTEFEIVGKTISLRKVEYNKEAPLGLSYGYGNGFKSGVKRDNFDNKKKVEILYVQGGERNIDASKYFSKELLLPKGQTLVYEGRTYETDEFGYSIFNANRPLSTMVEDSLDCSHIYPSRVGTISNVVTVDAAKNFYNFEDSSIPSDLNYLANLMQGETMTVIFQSGLLTGKEFDVSYIHATRTFKITPQEIDGVTMPKEGFKPAIGDTYIVYGISLPTAYVDDTATKTGASWDMFREGAKYLYEHEDDRFSFTGPLDGIWAKKVWLEIGGKIKLGGYVSFTDEQFQIEPALIRIVGIKDYVNKPYSPEIEISNVVVGAGFATGLRKLETTEVAIDQTNKNSIRFAKRGFREVKETTKLLEAAFTNFSGAVNPVSVQTMQILLGDESLQYRFVNSKITPIELPHDIVFNTGNKTLTAEAGIIQHMTLGIETLSSSHAVSEYKFWDMPEYNSAPLSGSSEPLSFYLYAKVSKLNQTGVFLLSETPIAIEAVADYYHLLVAIINSEFDGDRNVIPLYGFTEILPSRITTKKIVSPDGSTFFDLENNEIKGNIKFRSGETYVEVGAGIAGAVSTAAADATAKAEAAQAAAEGHANALANDLQNQIDGVIDSWFFDYSPTTSNYPASEWTTDEIRSRHLGDTFTNIQQSPATDAGKSWRWIVGSGGFVWTPISDSDAVLALQKAAAAQDTADGKRRVFTTTPTNAHVYDVGDLWVNATAGSYVNELLRCNTAKLAGIAFNLTHWEKATKYTDDSVANDALDIAGNAQDDANNALLKLSDIANDDKLTPDEKQLTKKEWNAILGEVTIIQNKADAFRISRTAFDAAYNALSTYITPLLADLTTTTDIVGVTFRAKFSDYYTARTNLLLAVASVDIGGVNLTESTNFTLYGTASNVARCLVGSTSPTVVSPSPYLRAGKKYVISVEKVEKIEGAATGARLMLYDFPADSSTGNTLWEVLIPSSDKQEISFVAPVSGNWSIMLYDGEPSNTTGNTFKFTNLMVQEGSRSTNFQTATKHLAEAFKSSTDITGGIVSTSVILLRNLLGEIMGGMSGLEGDNVATWAGGTYAQALAGIAKSIVYKDGSARHAGGNLTWDVAGNLKTKGEIEAAAGYFGLLRIFGSTLFTKYLKISEGAIATLASMLTIKSYTLATTAGGSVALTPSNPLHTFKTPTIFLDGETSLSTPMYLVPYASEALPTVGPSGSSVRVNMLLELVNNDVVIASNLFQKTVTPSSTIAYMDGPTLYGNTIQPGTVYLRATLYLDNMNATFLAGSGGSFGMFSARITANSEGYSQSATITAWTKRTEIGGDGLFSFWSTTQHLHYSKDNGLVLKGGSDMPGILAAGSVASSGAHSNRWGAKVATAGQAVVIENTVEYKVPHNIGHSSYTIQVSSNEASKIPYVFEKGTNYIKIVQRTLAGATTLGSFEYVIIGNNQ